MEKSESKTKDENIDRDVEVGYMRAILERRLSISKARARVIADFYAEFDPEWHFTSEERDFLEGRIFC